MGQRRSRALHDGRFRSEHEGQRSTCTAPAPDTSVLKASRHTAALGFGARGFPRYEAYRDSGVEWLGEVPGHWEVKRLKWSRAAAVNGVWGDEPDGENDIPCIRVADFDRRRFRVNFFEPTLRAITPSQRAGRELRTGDLLLEKSGGGDKQMSVASCSTTMTSRPSIPTSSLEYPRLMVRVLGSGRMCMPPSTPGN